MQIDSQRKITVMGIVNLTDDSFFAGSRNLREDGSLDGEGLARRVRTMLEEGADILDFGACSTRPGSDSIGAEEEWNRLKPALATFSRICPGAPLSIDTFRPEIARKAFDLVGPFTVNDISGGEGGLLPIVGALRLPYVAMHMRGTPKTMQSLTDYDDVTLAVHRFFETFAVRAHEYGIGDWILDPGFGFAKTVAQNWQLLREMDRFMDLGRPILVGLSRKSFIYKPSGISPAEALPGTQAAHLAALERGADILRVHDVAEAVRTIGLYRLLHGKPE